MNTRSDLCAGSHGGPGVYHGPLADISANIDERRHENRSTRHMGPIAHHRPRNGTYALELFKCFERDFVMEVKGPDVHGFHRPQPKIKQNGFLHPFVDHPGLGAVLRHSRSLSNAKNALIHLFKGEAYSITHIFNLQQFSILKGSLNQKLMILIHGKIPLGHQPMSSLTDANSKPARSASL